MLAQGRFGIGRAVEQNGDGITYLAVDAQFQKIVYVREFYPAAIAVREEGLVPFPMQGCEAIWQECAQNFTELWRKLQRLRGLSALLAVTDVFEENGTIYAVYDHTESVTFREFLLRSKQGNITWERARTLLMPVLSTLGNLHQQGILHRGISPTTLFYGADGKVRIGGFSIWQARTAHGELNANIADGYAALEQYGTDGKQGAWTDIYAFAAVLYRALVGTDPDDAVSRRHNDRMMVPAQIAERTPAYVLNALINAMQVFPEERTRTVEQFRAELSASPTAVHQSVTQRIRHSTSNIPQVAPPPKPAGSSNFLALKVAGIILGVGVLLAIIFLLIYPSTRDSILACLKGKLPRSSSLPSQRNMKCPTSRALRWRKWRMSIARNFVSIPFAPPITILSKKAMSLINPLLRVSKCRRARPSHSPSAQGRAVKLCPTWWGATSPKCARN